VEALEDGTRGLERLLASRPDIALIDVGLPGLDGYAVARAVRATSGAASLHLVALTGYGQPEDRRRGAEAGFDDYLVKPIDDEDLRRVLARVPGSGVAADAPTAAPEALAPLRELVRGLLLEISSSAALVDMSETPQGDYSITVNVPGEIGKALALPRSLVNRASTDAQARAFLGRLLRARILVLRSQVTVNESRESLASNRGGERCSVCSRMIPPGEGIVVLEKPAHPGCRPDPNA
jgi:CheY-like chemotaxis protein